jgi:hypothetical protein
MTRLRVTPNYLGIPPPPRMMMIGSVGILLRMGDLIHQRSPSNSNLPAEARPRREGLDASS